MIAFYLEKLPALTYRQIAFLDYVGERIANGSPPSMREIGAHFGHARQTGSQYFIESLRRKRLLVRDADSHGGKKGGARSLRLINCKWFPGVLKA